MWCACARVCVCVRARVCVCACVCVQSNRLRDMTDDVADAALFEDGCVPAAAAAFRVVCCRKMAILLEMKRCGSGGGSWDCAESPRKANGRALFEPASQQTISWPPHRPGPFRAGKPSNHIMAPGPFRAGKPARISARAHAHTPFAHDSPFRAGKPANHIMASAHAHTRFARTRASSVLGCGLGGGLGGTPRPQPPSRRMVVGG